MNDKNPAVVVTGASTGIGEACAVYLAERGYRVFGSVRKDADGEALRQRHAGITPLLFDVTDDEAVARAAGIVEGEVGDAGLAGLVNNAGISLAGLIEFFPMDALRQQIEVNTISVVGVTQAFLPLLRKARGRIVNMSSISGRVTFPFMGAYCASKYALEALSDALRVELVPAGIKVILIEPGSIATPIWEKGEQAAAELLQRAPEQVFSYYGPMIEAMRKVGADMAKAGIPPERVARVVWRALTVRRPRARYLVGRDALMNAIIKRWVPTRLFDAMIARQLNARPPKD